MLIFLSGNFDLSQFSEYQASNLQTKHGMIFSNFSPLECGTFSSLSFNGGETPYNLYYNTDSSQYLNNAIIDMNLENDIIGQHINY